MLVELEITADGPYAGGRRFGAVGAYQRIDAVARYAVDPAHHANAGIVDLELCERGADGRVHFSGDVTLLVPAQRERANRTLFLEVPNRGKRIAFRALQQAPADLASIDRLDPGDGFLLSRGFVVAWCGWQWDVPRGGSRLGLVAPLVRDPAHLATSRMQLRIQPNTDAPWLPLTDQHVGELGNHLPIRPADPEDPADRLLVREHAYAPAEEIPRGRWRFTTGDGSASELEYVALEGGFRAGRIYDLVYRPARCPVAGAGLLAVRDLGAWLRRDPAAATADLVEHAIVEGQSQCGRFLRTFLALGLNVAEDGGRVYDGVLAHIAGGRRGEFNHRYAQPSVQPTPSFGHRFPFADEPQPDPAGAAATGLLERQRREGGVPRIVYTDTSSEYWRGDASLAHTDATTGLDADLPDNVRRYLFASTQHGAGQLPFTHASQFGSHGANRFNVIDYRPLYRAALVNLLAWVRQGLEPPPSRVPRSADGSALPRAEVMGRLAAIPGLVLPDPVLLPAIYPLDLGPAAAQGVGTYPARAVGPAYPSVVSAVDADGNEIAGVRMPDVAVPLGTHTGFNPRHRSSGGAGQLLEYVGSSLPFAASEAQRRASGDPRPSIGARYRDRDDYLARVRAAADELVAARLLLEFDVELCLEIAAERYAACTAE